MKRELETKFAIREKAFLSLLERHGIHLTEPVEQRDTIYFRRGKGFSDLPHGEPVLRIRQAGNSITTTLKIYRNGISDRTEVECNITDHSGDQRNAILNPSFQGTAGKLRLPVRSGLRFPPAPELKRYRLRVDYWQWFDNSGDLPLLLEESTHERASVGRVRAPHCGVCNLDR